MDKATYARTILADRKASGSFLSALERSLGRRNATPVLILTFTLLGLAWTWTGLFPIAGGFLLGVAIGFSTLLLLQIKAYLRQKSLMEEFVDWLKVEEAAKEERKVSSDPEQPVGS
jgi:hypothetical protein